MKKVKLNLNQLKVDSFEVLKTNSKSGTIRGNAFTEYPCITDDPKECHTFDPRDFTCMICPTDPKV